MSATIELFEDARGEWRWRLRHDNGEIIADSGEGYSTEADAREAIDRIRDHAASATALDVTQGVFEVYEDEAEEWRWRLRHRNGRILADSGEGYASRSGTLDAIDGVKRNAPGAAVNED